MTTLTVLFTDLVGSTALMGELGANLFDQLLNEHDALVNGAIDEHGGTQVKHTGDGVMAVFTGATEALNAAVAIQQAVERRNRRADTAFEVRAGLSAGDVTDKDGDYFGTPVVEAARLCAASEGGQILAAAVVQVLAGSRGDHTFNPLGTLDLKGLPLLATVEVQWEVAPVEIVALPPALSADRSAFVGREAELAVLSDAWDDTRAGTRGFVTISGEPGIGKTRLAAELARRAHSDGAIVLLGRCDEHLGAPLAPIVEALRPVVGAASDAELAAWSADGAGELALLMPELHTRLRVSDNRPPADPDSQRLRLFDAIDRLLTGAAAEHPVLVVIEDLHWADSATALLVRHLSRSAQYAPVMVLGTLRDTDVEPLSPLADAPTTRVPLNGFDARETAALISSLGSNVDPAAICVETDGNPFFARELVAHLAESAEGTVPEGVRDVIGRRLNRLSEGTQRVLGVSAIIGREFDLVLLAAVCTESTDRLLDRLDEAGRTGLVAEVALARFGFSHALVQAALIDRLGNTRRLRLHQRIAQALEEAGSDDLAALAHHSLEAAPLGGAASAIVHTRRAAKQAMERYASQDARVLLERALELVDHTDDLDGLVRCEVLTDLARASFELLDADQARVQAIAAARLAVAAGSVAHLVNALFGVTILNYNDQFVTDPDRLEVLRGALTLVDSASSRDRALLLSHHALAMHGDGTPEAEAVARDALVAAAESGDPVVEAKALTVLALVLPTWRPPHEVLDLTRRARELLVGTSSGAAWFHPALHTNPHVRAGDRAAYETALAEIEDRSDGGRDQLLAAVLQLARAQLALVDGRFDEAERVSGSTRYDNYPMFRLMQHFQLVAILRERGQLDAVIDRFEAAPATVPGSPSVSAGYAEALAELGRDDDARRMLEELAVNGFAVLDKPAGVELALRNLAETIAWLDEPSSAAMIHSRLAPYDGQVIVGGAWSSVEGAAARGLAELETVLGRYHEAESHYAAAIELEHRMHARVCLPRTKYWYARMLLAREGPGDGSRAVVLLDEVIAESSELGMRAIEVQARALR